MFDTIKCGKYEQDNNLENGPEPIEWIDLDYDDQENKSLLLSKYGLDASQYHADGGEITWEGCSLRNWLNWDFLNDAFTVPECHIACGDLQDRPVADDLCIF